MGDDLKDKYLALKKVLGELNAPGAQRVLDYAYFVSQNKESRDLCDVITENAISEMPPADQNKFRTFMFSIAMLNLATMLAVGETIEDFTADVPEIE